MTNPIKYPRTPHLPWSDGANESRDDLLLSPDDMKKWAGYDVVVTAKLDGSNVTLYHDYIHSRSLTMNNHISFDWIKGFHANIKHQIPKDWRICGENLKAKHSIYYHDLEDYFLVFSIWDEYNHCLSWEDTVVWSEIWGLKTVPMLYYGLYNEQKIRQLYPEPRSENREGYVVRKAGAFPMSSFSNSIAKYVRKNHVDPDMEHWDKVPIIWNKLRDTSGPD